MSANNRKSLFSLTRLQKGYGASLLTLHFLSFFVLSVSLMGLASYMSYTSTKKAEERNFSESTERSQRLIVRLVESYNIHMDNLYKNIDKAKIERIYNQIAQLGIEPLSHDTKFLVNFSKKEKVRISLIDFQTGKTLWTSKRLNNTKYEENLFPEYKYIYKDLVPDHPHMRLTWVEKNNKLNLIVRQVSKNNKYVWRLVLPVEHDIAFDHLIKFLKNTKYYEPLIESTGMYSFLKQNRHGIDYLKLPEDIDLVVNTKKCFELSDCSLWKKINLKEHQQNNSYISYVGLKFSSKVLQKKLAIILDQLYLMIFVSLILSLILSYVFSQLFSRAIQKVLRVVRKINSNMNSEINFPLSRIKELNEMIFGFKNLLKRFQMKRRRVIELAKSNLSAADKERRDISRDLHDTVGQLLVAANLKILAKDYEDAEKNINIASEELRAIYDELEPRSLEKMTLNQAVEWYFLKFFPKNFLYDIDVELADSFETTKKVQIYRIIQEAIANIRKHAKDCTYISITLEKLSDSFCLKIINNGVTSLEQREHFCGRGLENIALRAETFGGVLQANNSNKNFQLIISFNNKRK